MRRVSAWVAAVMLAVFSWSVAWAAPPLEVYGKLPGFEMAALSPSGQRYAVIGVVEDARRFIALDAQGKGLLTAPVGDQKVTRIGWAGEDIVLVWTSSTYVIGPSFNVSKLEVAQLMVINLRTQSSYWAMTKGAAGNGVHGTYAITQEDGRWYGYFGGITMARGKGLGQYYFDSGHPDLYRIDLETGEYKLAAKGSEGGSPVWRDWLVGPDGSIVASSEFNKRSGAWRIREGKTGADLAAGANPLGGVELLGRGRTPGTILYSRPKDDDESDWVEVPLTGGEGEVLLAEEPVLARVVDRVTGLFAGYARDGDRPETRFFDPVREKRMRAIHKAFPGLNVVLWSTNDAFDRIIVRTDGPGDAGTWWLVSIATGKADVIGTAYPAVKSKDVGPMEVVSWKAADGMEMQGVLTLPPGREAKDLPLVVLPHGGPHARDYPVFDWQAQVFASRGYAVFQPNFRGSSGYGYDFYRAGDGEWGRKMQTDVSDGVAALAARGTVDRKRACIMGFSYGGYAALAGVTLQNGLYRCAVAVAGVSDLPDLFSYDVQAYGGASPLIRNWRLTIGEGKDLVAISPARQAARADAPILLIHGRDDTNVPIDQSRIMERELRRAGKPVEFVTLKGEDHDFMREESRLEMLKAAVAFVEKHNPPDPAP